MASRFVFRLQPLLDERRRIEQAKQRAFALAAQVLEKRSRDRDGLVRALRAGGRALHECAMRGSTDGARLYDAHLRYLERAVASCEQRNAESAIALDRAACELRNANRERRVVEKLKARRLQEFERADARREELELQETNARRCERMVR
jgi:flagellar biosynthesis chaperone FliJ